MNLSMHPEALTETGSILFPKLAKFGKDFYLVGGTALALQIGHRLSVDFDMFSDNEVSRNLLAKVKHIFADSFITSSINNPEQLNVSVEGVKMTFFWYRYPPILPLVTYQGVNMISVAEIAAMKAFAIGQRGTFRDYVDMYFLFAENHVTIEKISELAHKKYPGEFNERLFLEQLLYLDDVKEVPVDFLRDPVEREAIQEFLKEQVRALKF